MSNIIDTIKEKLNVGDLKDLSPEQYQKILEIIKENDFSLAQLTELVKVIPNIVDLQKTYLDSMRNLYEGIKDSQNQTLLTIQKNIDSLTSVLNKIVDKAETEATLQMVAQILMQMADLNLKIIEEINKNNNQSWFNLAKFATTAVLMVGALVAIAIKRK